MRDKELKRKALLSIRIGMDEPDQEPDMDQDDKPKMAQAVDITSSGMGSGARELENVSNPEAPRIKRNGEMETPEEAIMRAAIEKKMKRMKFTPDKPQES